MSYPIFVLTTKLFLFIFLIIQNLEFWFIYNKKDFLKIWSEKNLFFSNKRQFKLLKIVFKNSFFKYFLLLQTVLILVLIFQIHPVFLIFLFLINWAICIRFRGLFNGGSDMMSFIILTGLILTELTKGTSFYYIGALYITINCLLSYFKAGLVKIVNSEWRTGRVMPVFLSRSLLTSGNIFASFLEKNLNISKLMCWTIILFELSIFMVFIAKELAVFYCLTAILFHFSVFLFFGLNRFFWIWLSAWPSVLFLVQLIDK